MDRKAGSALFLVALAVVGSCVGPDEDTGSQRTVDLLEGTPAVLLAAHDDADPALTALEAATQAWAEAPADDQARVAAQEAWTAFFLAWQQLELMQLGPAGSSLSVPKGQDLRDEIYSWPTVNPCRVDQETLEENWDASDFFAANLVNSYGLDALEQVLFGGEEDTCVAQVGIDEAWEALGPEGVQANRAAFSVALTAGVRSRFDELGQAWASWTPKDSEELLQGLIYLDLVTKDRKLAQPLGLLNCGTERCPEDAEALASGASSLAVQANLQGFRHLFTGGEGVGLDDLLAARGRQDLVDEVLEAVAAAEQATLDAPIDEAVVDDPAAVEEFHARVKAITDPLKGEVATVLSLRLPSEADGDAD